MKNKKDGGKKRKRKIPTIMPTIVEILVHDRPNGFLYGGIVYIVCIDIQLIHHLVDLFVEYSIYLFFYNIQIRRNG